METGTNLGPYQILEQLGAGGMGEVYRARDTRLERDVAIKILLPAVAANPDFRARFEREAKVISSLNHPNICTLYDVGEADGTHFLAMELIEGESLADRLAGGPLPVPLLLRYGAQIAEALAQAHKQGIVHRDLKPGNVMLTRTGAKLLDFGLARATAEPGPVGGPTEMATAAEPLTSEGMILGTFQYMAPEQLEGLPADARTDIFAFGALLYEMATARRAFEGSSRTSLIAAIVASQPEPIATVTATAPPALDHVVRRCLEKDPDDRWQSAHDVACELRWLVEAGSAVGATPALSSSRRLRRNVLSSAAVAGWTLAVVAAAWIFLGPQRAAETSQPFRADLEATEGAAYGGIGCGNVSLSPSGDRLAFRADTPTGARLAVRSFATGDVDLLEGAENPCFVFWSPDGRFLAFFEGQKLRKVAAGGGPVETVADVPAGRGGTWNRDGTIVYAPNIEGSLMRVPDSGGTPQQVTTLGDAYTHRNPHFLPDGEHFLFNVRAIDRSASLIAVGSLGGEGHSTVIDTGSNPQWADGHIFFTRDRNLMVQRFDLQNLEAEGAAVPIASALQYYSPRSLANFSVSSSGLLVYRQSTERHTQLAWYGSNGAEAATIGEPGPIAAVRSLSGDQSRALLQVTGAGTLGNDLWVMDLERQQMTRSTFLSSSRDISGALSNNGDRLAVSDGQGATWLQSSSGNGEREMLLQSDPFLVTAWSVDGRYLVGKRQQPETNFDVAYIDLEQGNDLLPFAANPFAEEGPRLSPDGKWLAYHSNESGRMEVYVADFPLGRQKRQVSIGGGNSPRWADNARLFYQGTTGLIGVTLTPGDPLQISEPTQLVASDQLPDSASSIDYMVGDRYLGLRHPFPPKIEPLRLIRNWQSLLE